MKERGTEVQKNDNELVSINNKLKCKFIKCPNQKTQNSRMDKKIWPTHMLPTGHPPQNERPTQTESEGLEINIPSKWTRKKKSRGSNIHTG